MLDNAGPNDDANKQQDENLRSKEYHAADSPNERINN